MRHISLEHVEPGNVLARSIFASDGRTLLNRGVTLTPMLITKLRRLGVTMVYIQDKNFADIKIEDSVSEETRRKAISCLSEAIECIQEGRDFDAKQVSSVVKSTVDEIVSNKDVLLSLADVRTEDNHLFVHSLNVCMISTIIGTSLGYTIDQLRELAMGALLHDIGKVTKKDPLHHKDGDHHAWVGFNVLRKKHDINLRIAHVALQHHEHVDGTGVPRGVKDKDIHEYAKIVAIANHYDKLVSPSFAGGSDLPPHEASEQIMALAGTKFEHKYVVEFLRAIAMYPTGTAVKIDKQDFIGIVVKQNKGIPSRPVIRIINEKVKTYNEDPQVVEIDLSKITTIFIKEVLIG